MKENYVNDLKVLLPLWLRCKESACNAGGPGLIPGWGKIPWGREWQPTPVFLPGESHGERSLWATVHGVTKSWGH